MIRSFVRGSVVCFGGAIAVLSACGGDDGMAPPPPPPPPTPSSIQIVSGDGQSGTVGQQLSASVIVRVDDQRGDPMSGVQVTFTVPAGGGSVGSPTTTTDGSGQASTTWTLGTTAGSQQMTAVVATVSNVTRTVTVTATPDVAAVISRVSGDGQSGFMGTNLADPIVVQVRDQFANTVPGHLVEFSAAAGNGTLDSTVAFTNASGRAVTGWTMPNSEGIVSAEVRSDGLTGSPVTFTATSHNTQITSVTDPLVEGQAAVIMGTGFDSDPAQNLVTIDGDTASVTMATDTQLDILVPPGCTPARVVDVKVMAAGIAAAPFTVDFTPATSLSLAPGEQMIIQDPADFCFQFPETSDTETYLIGIQSITETATSRTAVTLTSVAGPGPAPAPRVIAGVRAEPRSRAIDPELARRIEFWRRHRAAEARLLQRELEAYRARPRSTPRAQGPSRIPADPVVGDTIPIRIGDENATCNDFTTISTVVRVVGARSVWLEDTANPSGGFSTANFQSFSDSYDNTIYDTDVSYFGDPGDIDGNGLIAAVVTKEVNRRTGVAGFVSPRDLNDVSTCAASNEGELFYAWAPDPNGTFGDTLDLDFASDLMPLIAAHETVHISQLGRRTAAMASLQDLWEIEGQATLGEEVNGHAAQGNTVGQNYPANVAFDFNTTRPTDWYIGVFINLFFYYGADLGVDPPVKVNGAPEDCTWIDKGINHACVGALVSGVPWSFLRWLSDQFGSTFAGGEQELQRALIDNTTMVGFANIADVIGQPIETLLAQWAAMLYVDDRILSDGTQVVPDPTLTMTSWDMFDVVEGTLINGGNVHRLVPAERGFQNFAESLNVRAGSTGYLLVSSTGRPATAIQARDDSDQTLPSFMQYWIVRLQ